jgi:hypothetical protein
VSSTAHTNVFFQCFLASPATRTASYVPLTASYIAGTASHSTMTAPGQHRIAKEQHLTAPRQHHTATKTVSHGIPFGRYGRIRSGPLNTHTYSLPPPTPHRPQPSNTKNFSFYPSHHHVSLLSTFTTSTRGGDESNASASLAPPALKKVRTYRHSDPTKPRELKKKTHPYLYQILE